MIVEIRGRGLREGEIEATVGQYRKEAETFEQREGEERTTKLTPSNPTSPT